MFNKCFYHILDIWIFIEEDVNKQTNKQTNRLIELCFFQNIVDKNSKKFECFINFSK
jgi:hypothetical protein